MRPIRNERGQMIDTCYLCEREKTQEDDARDENTSNARENDTRNNAREDDVKAMSKPCGDLYTFEGYDPLES